jgi:hypothetical protein
MGWLPRIVPMQSAVGKILARVSVRVKVRVGSGGSFSSFAFAYLRTASSSSEMSANRAADRAARTINHFAPVAGPYLEELIATAVRGVACSSD